jgi:uncharacterized membrane protein YvbJ
MSLGMLLSHMRRKKPTQKCERCGLRYAFDSESCPHCPELSDEEVVLLREKLVRQQKRHARLGMKMFLVAAVLFVFILAFTM